MTERELRKLDKELSAFLEEMVSRMGRPERRQAMSHYITGLLLDGERKSVQPMAARLVDNASEAEAMRQRLQECVGVSTWSDEEVLRRLAKKLDQELPGIEVWVVDDTGFPKKGRYSVGVARQYTGTLGRTDNCQVATSLHLAGERGSSCIGLRVYLPKEWTEDRDRCRTAGVPETVHFQTKWEIALGEIDQALAWGLQRRPSWPMRDTGRPWSFARSSPAEASSTWSAFPQTIWSGPRTPTRSRLPVRPENPELPDKHGSSADPGPPPTTGLYWRQGWLACCGHAGRLSLARTPAQAITRPGWDPSRSQCQPTLLEPATHPRAPPGVLRGPR